MILGAASNLVGNNASAEGRGFPQGQTVTGTCETSLSTQPPSGASRPGATTTSTVGAAGSSSSIGGSTQTLSAQSNATTHSSSTLHGLDGGPSTGGFNSEPVSLDSVASMGIIASTSGTERSRDLALCAVLMDEWLKELAAIAQEQSVVLVTEQPSL